MRLRSDFKIEIVQQREPFLNLRQAWNRLLEASAYDTVFLTHEWFEAFIKAFCREVEFAVALIYCKHELIGILPLCRPARGPAGLRIFTSMTNEHAQKFSFIFKSGYEQYCLPALARLGARLGWDMIRCDYVSGDSFMLQSVGRPREKGVEARAITHMESPRIELNEDWETYYRQTFSKALRNKTERMIRKAQREYEVGYEVLKGEQVREQDLKEAFMIEDSGWKGRNQTSILKDRRVQRFYETLAQSAAKRSWLVLRFLTFSGQRVAFEYSLHYKGHDNPLKAGYLKTYKKLTPGHIMTRFSIQQAFLNRDRVFDFLGWADAYKLRMSNSEDPLFRIYYFGSGLRSKALRFMRFDAKALAERIGIEAPLKRIAEKWTSF